MKFKQTFFFFAISAFSLLPSVSVDAKGSFIEVKDHHERDYSKEIHSSLQKMVYENPIPAEETAAFAPIVVPSASASSSLLHRNLRKEVAESFKQCFETCMDTNVVLSTPDDSCCAGGVSFLKMEFHGQMNGTIALGSSQSCGSSQGHKHSKAGSFPKTSSSSSNAELRIVDCNDICVQKPFGGFPCDLDSVVNEKEIAPGSAFCIAMVRPSKTLYEYEVAFDQKMDHNVNVLFLGSEGFSVGAIHTSCSKPLSLSWGVLFGDCSDSESGSSKNKNEHIDVSNFVDNSVPYLSFIDGISTEYFITAENALSTPNTTSYVKNFDIGFNNCGCTCERSDAAIPVEPSSTPSKNPSPVPSFVPSKNPTPSPSSKSSSSPSVAPTESATSTTTFSSTPSHSSIVNPGPGSPIGSTCNSACSAFILQHCVFVGTNNACDVNGQVPIIADDDMAEGAAVATLPPTLLANDAETFGKVIKTSKGKGSKGSGKSGHGKAKSKSYKRDSFVEDAEGEHSHKKGGHSTYYSKLEKYNKAKGSKGRQLSDPEYERHLQKIEYHRSRIDYFEKLLMQFEG